MIEQVVGNKKYVLEKIIYDVVGGSESVYIQLKIIEDIPFGVNEYSYGLSFNQDEIPYFVQSIVGLKEYVVGKLIELNA